MERSFHTRLAVAMNSAIDLQVFRRRCRVEDLKRNRLFGGRVIRIAIVPAVRAPHISDVGRNDHCRNRAQCWYNFRAVGGAPHNRRIHLIIELRALAVTGRLFIYRVKGLQITAGPVRRDEFGAGTRDAGWLSENIIQKNVSMRY